MLTVPQPRAIQSFARKQGRLRNNQRQALTEFWPRYGLELTATQIDPGKIFGRTAPLYLEIGFGMGQALLSLAEHHPHYDYLGIEVYQPGMGTVLAGLAKKQLNNVRLFKMDAVAVLKRAIPDHSLAGVYLFFPDPWPKKRHHKRRLVQADFVELLLTKLQPQGIFHIATDWQDYADHCLQVLAGYPALVRLDTPPLQRPLTKFEQRGLKLGHAIVDLAFQLA